VGHQAEASPRIRQIVDRLCAVPRRDQILAASLEKISHDGPQLLVILHEENRG